MAVKRTVSLHPATVIFALTSGATLFGFLGLILSIPAAAAVKALMLRYVFDEPAEGIEPIQALRRAAKTVKETRLRAALPLIAVRWKEGLFD